MRTELSRALTTWLRGAAALVPGAELTASLAQVTAVGAPPTAARIGEDRAQRLSRPVGTRPQPEMSEVCDPLAAVVGRFRQAFDHAPIGMSLLSLDCVILDANIRLAQILGVPLGRVAGIRIADVTHPDDREAEARDFESLKTGERSEFRSEKRYVRVDGEVVWVARSASIVRNERGDPWYFVSMTDDITARKTIEAELAFLATHDELTGMFNRRQFHAELDMALARSRRASHQLALMTIDIDNFKQINDTFGHATGDLALNRVADALRTRLRATDVLARIGGDEFGAILPEVNRDAAHDLAVGLLHRIRDASVDGQVPDLSVSVGVAFTPERAPIAPSDLLAHADEAMYEAKRAGRDTCRFHAYD